MEKSRSKLGEILIDVALNIFLGSGAKAVLKYKSRETQKCQQDQAREKHKTLVFEAIISATLHIAYYGFVSLSTIETFVYYFFKKDLIPLSAVTILIIIGALAFSENIVSYLVARHVKNIKQKESPPVSLEGTDETPLIQVVQDQDQDPNQDSNTEPGSRVELGIPGSR
jgi:hypothetical protein